MPQLSAIASRASRSSTAKAACSETTALPAAAARRLFARAATPDAMLRLRAATIAKLIYPVIGTSVLWLNSSTIWAFSIG